MSQAKAILLAACLGVYLAPAHAFIGYSVPLHPPARFDHPHPNMVVKHFSPSEVDRLCRRIGAKAPKPIKGCAAGDRRGCLVILPHGASAAVLRHERAHCNGWPKSHPD